MYFARVAFIEAFVEVERKVKDWHGYGRGSKDTYNEGKIVKNLICFPGLFSYPSWSSKVSVAPETFLNSLLTFVRCLKAPPISYSFQHIPSEAILVESPSAAGFPKSPPHYCSPPYLRIQG